MENRISLGSDLAGKLSSCKVGDTKTIEVTVKVTKMDGGLEGTVTGIGGYEEEPEEETEMPTPPKKGKRPAALEKAMSYEE